KMISSQEELPNFNGKIYTKELLMKDFLRYSLIADQANGAIGFRQLLPFSLFEKYKVSDYVREAIDDENITLQRNLYEKAYKHLEILLKSKITPEGKIYNFSSVSKSTLENIVNNINKEIVKEENKVSITEDGHILILNYLPSDYFESFSKQFFQHNTNLVKKLPFQALEKVKRIYGKNIENVDYISLSMPLPHKFFSIQTNKGKTLLFEFVEIDPRKGTILFKKIPTLGTFGFNEYKPAVDKNISKIRKNNFITSYNNEYLNNKELTKLVTKNYKNTIKDMISSIKNDKEHSYYNLMNFLSPFIENTEFKFEVVKEDFGSYAAHSGNTIFISEPYLESKPLKSTISHLLTEEILHVITSKMFDPYVNFTGVSETGKILYEIKKDENGKNVVLPSQLQTLIEVYQYAFNTLAKKNGLNNILKQISDKQKIDSNNITEGIENYRVSTIHEFIAGIFLKGENFATEMANTPYLKSGESVLSKITKTIVSLLNRLLPNGKTDTVSAVVAAELHSYLLSTKEIKEERKYNNHFKDDNVLKTAKKMISE
ncbi:MAG: hypothetical protein ACRC0V_05765, partial [Fusobacteriaceae bacterium]